MWLLLFVCVSTVGGVPIKAAHEATSAAPGNVTTVPSVPDLHQPTMKDHLEGGLPLNDTRNVTSPASDAVPSVIDPLQQASAETLEELLKDFGVHEGDILIPEDRNAVEALWANAVIPYTISDELADRQSDILAAFKMISDFTCIRFQKRTTEMNYLKFQSGRGCASFVGCQGGAQPLFYGQSCSVGNLCHEIVHALGLHHEHTRQDRDQYITVQWTSIRPGRKKNFKMQPGNTLNLPYDLNSIMHYGQYFFSKDGSATLLPKQSGEQMGQRSHLSALDIQRLNKLYRCDERIKGL